MTLQTEPGKSHRPMRPTVLILPFTTKTLQLDVSPVDWTVAATKLPFAAGLEFFDDNDKVAIDDANDEIDLPPGIWEVEVNVGLTNADATNDESAQLALTNAAGTTVHYSTQSQPVDAGESRIVRLHHILHLTANDSIAIRGAQVTDTGGGANLSVVNGDRGMCVRKIGNANEA